MPIPTRHKIFIVGIAAGVLLSTILAFWFLRSADQRRPGGGKSGDLVIAQTTDLLSDEKNTISVFEDASASVVFIINKAIQRDMFSLNSMEIPQGSGTGFMWDNKGHIVTNYHVIANANALTVTLHDQASFEADIVGAEPNKDIAVLRINVPKEKIKPVKIGSSSNLRVGQKVLAIGNPFGLDQTLTVGVVSALGREIKSITDRTIHDVIQTDTAINPGNSGGPLLDSGGNLIGVNTAIISPSGASAGVGFAVPVNTVRTVVPQLIEHGKVIHPGLGIRVLPESVAERIGVEGIVIAEVIRGGSADRAGLKGIEENWRGRSSVGDIIIAVNDQKVLNADELSNVLEQHRIGETVQVKILRDGKEKEIPIQLQQID